MRKRLLALLLSALMLLSLAACGSDTQEETSGEETTGEETDTQDFGGTELVVATSTDTPVYRQLKDQFLMQMFQMNAIPVEVLLQNSSLQGSDVILAQLQKAREQMAQQKQQMMMAQQGAAAPAGMPAAQPVPPQQPAGGAIA